MIVLMKSNADRDFSVLEGEYCKDLVQGHSFKRIGLPELNKNNN